MQFKSIPSVPIASKRLGCLLIMMAAMVFSMQAQAQQVHGVANGKACPTATKVGDEASCLLTVENADEFGDTIVVNEVWDVIDPGGALEFRNPATGNLPIVEVSANVICTPDAGEPIGLAFPCELPGTAVEGGSGEYVIVESEYIVPAGATDPLLDQGNFIVTDQCDVQPVGCNNQPQLQQFGAAVSLFEPALEVTKTGPDAAKVGDEITFTIGFTDTSTGTGFPGFENCTGSDTVLGDLGAFEAGVTRDFNYTVTGTDPDPLDNVATITCGVVGMDNEASDDDDHSVDLIDPSIEVTKTGPDTAKVGDEVTYTIGFTDTGSGTLENCTGSDTVLGDLGAFEAGVTRDFMYTVTVADPDPLDNVATITCDVAGFDNQASDSDDHSVDLIDPSIEVTKTGPDAAKVGDEITFTIGYVETGTGAVENCTGSDTILGDLGAFEAGVTRDFMYTVTVADPDPLNNVATITCGVVGFDNQASDSDDHSVDLIDPSIEVTKSGPDVAKVGDEITYTIGFTDTGSGTLENCTGSDTALGDLGAFEAGVMRDFTYTLTVADPDPLDNVATITCDVAGFDNQASDSDDHSVDLIDPSIEVTKLCRPDPVNVGESIEWLITVNNTGDADLNCLVNDPTAGYTDEPLMVAAGGSEELSADRTVVSDDAPLLSNTVEVSCQVDGFDNVLTGDASADCEVIEVAEICRSPGFWSTHAGSEHPKSTDLVQLAIDAAGGSIEVCGQTLDNTDVGNMMSALEAMCVTPRGDQQLQLIRQLTAASLNCIVSGGDADCSGTSVESLWADANAACIADSGNLSSWIGEIDDFNNDPECQDRELDESDVFDSVSKLPGPAGSPRSCNSARRNDVVILP